MQMGKKRKSYGETHLVHTLSLKRTNIELRYIWRGQMVLRIWREYGGNNHQPLALVGTLIYCARAGPEGETNQTTEKQDGLDHSWARLPSPRTQRQ
jgi:hypothetical protein